MVPKRGWVQPLVRAALSFTSASELGAHLDIGRRFGRSNEFGVRFNNVYRAGHSMVRDNATTLGMASLALDYSRDRLRITVDSAFQKQWVDGVVNSLGIRPGIAVPKAPSARNNVAQPWEYFDEQNGFFALRGEYDLSKDVTVYAGYGMSRFVQWLFYATPQIINANGDTIGTPFSYTSPGDKQSTTAGLRARATTGPVRHQFSVQYVDLPWNNGGTDTISLVNEPISSNIYNPVRFPIRGDARERRAPAVRFDLINRSFGFTDTLSLFGERLSFTVGGRIQRVGRRNFDVATQALLPTSYDEAAFTPGLTVAVKPLQRLTIYGNYVEAFQQGFIVSAPNLNAGDAFPPFRSKQHEIGVKYNFGAAGVTVAAFQIAQPNAIVTLLPGGQQRQDLNGQVRSRGLETSLFGNLGRRVRLLGGATFLDGTLTRTATLANGTNNNGRTAPGVPAILFNLYAEYDTPLVRGLTLTVRNLSTSSQFVDQANAQSIPKWTRFDIGARYRIDYRDRPVTLRLEIENLADSTYYSAASPFGGSVAVAMPRTVQVGLEFDLLSFFR